MGKGCLGPCLKPPALEKVHLPQQRGPAVSLDTQDDSRPQNPAHTEATLLINSYFHKHPGGPAAESRPGSH